MTQKNVDVADLKSSLLLKLPETDVAPDEPWRDDVLGRKQIATRLTNLVRSQSAPFVVSIDGYWGTGKTFLLKRWQKTLEKEGFRAIYFNAWEDDFCDDPLVAILGQMSEYFKDGPFMSLAKRVRDSAIPLVRRNVLSLLEKHTGLALVLDEGGGTQQDPLENYLSQRATKDDLKKRLTEMAEKVRDETGQPMVFIIDELDRCRPTFAIELLERVKHIFDVRGLVFVLGVNREELCSSLQSVYGNIDASVYFRRFFDIEFTLPQVDGAVFARHLMQRFELTTYFGALSTVSQNRIHADEFEALLKFYPRIWGDFGLSLRDIDHCVKLIALVAKNLDPGYHMYHWLLGLLVALKLTNPPLYRSYIQGDCLGSMVMDHIDQVLLAQGSDSTLVSQLDLIETYLYIGDRRSYGQSLQPSSAREQLQLLRDGQSPTHPEYLSKRTQTSDGERIPHLLRLMTDVSSGSNPDNLVGYLAQLIDLQQELVRR